ncbi:glutamine amidotransferase [Pelagicoccus sp. SDUM812005]|uniref:glutamine amidotransferase n=1 Tax=Pelagicoccus sp. SDUM812005 TaxID=3041257 RepID=UPI0028104E47|nr:glutamine amidotransferase [Pelagicoccus sp. SDUM812005]MDQ8181662.1 glutamine amidotransferase [Pelagicoccus sp. SDUM812005]
MTFTSNIPWLAFAIALIVLLPLSWLSWKSGSDKPGPMRLIALSLRVLGILFVAFAIADPQIVGERPVQGANIVALVADNSKGLAIREGSQSLSRGDQLRQRLSDSSQAWMGSLRDDYQVRSYQFDSQLRRTAGFETLDFTGEESAIGSSLKNLAERLRNKPVAGIVLFSDGNRTDMELTPEELAELPPVFPIVVGESDRVSDLSIQDLRVEQSAFGDSPLRLTATLRQSHLSEQAVRTQLKRIDSGNQLSQTSAAPLHSRTNVIENEDRYSYEWKAPGGGIQFFELSSFAEDPNATEATLDNNRQLFAVDRGKDSYRILYVTGRPNWEYKFLNRALASDPQLDLVGLLRVANREPKFEFKSRAGENSNALYRGFGREDETERYDEAVLIRMNARDENELKTGFPDEAEELFAYDAIIIDDLEADFFSFSQQTLIRDFVKQRGGGLLVLGGVNALEDGNYQNTPIAQVLPLYLDGMGPSNSFDKSARWDLTRNGWVEPWMRIRPFETEEQSRILAMPSFRVFNATQRTKPGAQTLATIEDLQGESYPALVTQRFGTGRVATVAVGDFWRWGMQTPSSQADLAQFWRQVSRWLVKDNPNRVELTASEVSESSVTLKAIARDSEFVPLAAGTATLSLERVDKAEQAREYEMKLVSNSPGQFTSKVALPESGAYRAKISVYDLGGKRIGEAETGWVYQPLVKELQNLSPNPQYLETLARATGGEVLSISALGGLHEILNARSSPVMETWSEPLWHRNWLFLLALSAFLSEWLLRRKRGLA